MADVDGELGRIVAERACERLVSDYAWFVDSGAAGRVADLFTEDGEWVGADGRGMHGNQEIRDAFTGRQAITRRQSRHVITNVRIDLDGSDRAVGTAYLVNYRHDAQGDTAAKPAPGDHPKFVGDYHFTFRRTAAGWRIETLRFDLAFLRTRRTPPHTDA